jgi:uncharacterized membrane protein YkvA (DUF1232 family)
MLTWVAIGLGVCVLLWALAVAALVAAGRGADARALARFVPDCIVLFRRLLADDRIPRRRKLALVALLGYLASPIDLVPDFIPVAGQLDDVLAVVLVLRFVLRSADDDLLAEHWPGPPRALALLRP